MPISNHSFLTRREPERDFLHGLGFIRARACFVGGISLFLSLNTASVFAAQSDVAANGVVTSPATPPVWEVNAGVVFTGTPESLLLTVPSRTWAGGKTITRIATACDCLVLKTKLPLDIADTEKAPLEFVYTPKDVGEWNVEVIVELNGANGREKKHLVLYGVTCAPAWRLNASDAIVAQKSGKAQLVDLRDGTAWNAAHAAGSLHLRPGEILRNRALKNRPLILIGDNLTDDTALTTAAQLRQKGFTDVRVVSGGLAAWLGAGGAVGGTDVARARAVSVSEVTNLALTVGWVPVFIGTPVSELLAKKALAFSATAPATEIIAVLKDADDKRLLFITADGTDASALLEKLPASLRSHACYLIGGRQALVEHAAARDKLAQNSTPVTVQAGSRLMLARSACGGCGRK